jgi:small subunit ribosomal protein S11
MYFASPNGNIISWASAGKSNFHRSRKSTAYVAQTVVQDDGKAIMSHGMKGVRIRANWSDMARDAAIRTIQSLGLILDEIIDVMPIPHNGCRPRKARRAKVLSKFLRISFMARYTGPRARIN